VARIVAGIDGSSASRSALAWAAAEARLRDWPLLVVHAWSLPLVPATPGFIPAPVEPGEYRRAAEELTGEVVGDVLADAADLQVETAVVEGPAAQALLERVEADDLLVIGSRGHGGFAGLLLGSVSQQCAQHAPCPVVIVRGDESA
jgi:nucleotide-binding universal stress UspA family protein